MSIGHLYLADQRIADWRIMWIRYSKTVQQIYCYCYTEHICVYVCVCELYLWYTTTYKYISTSQDRSISVLSQHFSHRLSSLWSMFTSPPLQDKNLYWRPESIMPTQRATQLLIPSSIRSCVARLVFPCREAITLLHKNSGLATRD